MKTLSSSIESEPNEIAPATKAGFPERAVVSIVFACFSFWIMMVAEGSSTGMLQDALQGKDLDWVRDNIARADAMLQSRLAVGYRGLALAALVWCIWAGRSEARSAMSIVMLVVATLFTGGGGRS